MSSTITTGADLRNASARFTAEMFRYHSIPAMTTADMYAFAPTTVLMLPAGDAAKLNNRKTEA